MEVTSQELNPKMSTVKLMEKQVLHQVLKPSVEVWINHQMRSFLQV